jgi:hypothetical protein
MTFEDYRKLCLDIAKDLGPAYAADVDKNVLAFLASGRERVKSGQLIDLGVIATEGEKVARLLVDLIGVYIVWRNLPKKNRRKTFESAMKVHIDDLGSEDQKIACRLAKDLNAWLKKRGDDC